MDLAHHILEYVNCCVGAFANRFNLPMASAYAYLRRFKAIDFLIDCYSAEHTLSVENAVEDITLLCQKHGGRLAWWNCIMEVLYPEDRFQYDFHSKTSKKNNMSFCNFSDLFGRFRKRKKTRFTVAKTEHSHPLGMVVSTHFRCGKGVKRGLKNGALPFNID